MCQRVQCSKCKRPTYAGCGMHIESVLRDVPKTERCRCREDAAQAAGAGAGTRGSGDGGFLSKLFGR